MAFAANHSANLPREFAHCPQCGKKGLYRYGGKVMKHGAQLDGHPPGKRCKYCGNGTPEMTQAEFLRQINK